MSLHITSQSKLARLRPTTKDELRYIIEQELERQGPDADLNFIDTSMITDMSALFEGFNRLHAKFFIRNIKIDSWNVSNVENMSYMFYGSTYFSCDLSRWDVSHVQMMNSMFWRCTNFTSDLSNWNTSWCIDMESTVVHKVHYVFCL